MKTNTTSPDYKGFRFPPEMISHAVWLYFRVLPTRCVYGLPTSWLFQPFDDEKLNKRSGDRMKDENLITVVFNRSPGRTRQAVDAGLLAIAAAGTGGDSPGRDAGAGFQPIGSVLSAL
jgi:hypothetical protein